MKPTASTFRMSSRIGLLLGTVLLALAVAVAFWLNRDSTGAIHADQPPVKVDLARLTFADPLIEKRFTRFNRFAASVAQDDWYHRPYQRFTRSKNSTAYFAEWAPFTNKNGRRPVNYYGPQECHSLGSNLCFNPQNPEQILGVSFWCHWNPADRGWSANVEYCTSNEHPVPHHRGSEQFSLTFLHHPLLEDPDLERPFFRVDREGNADYQSNLHVDGVVYRIKIDTWDSVRRRRLQQRQPDEKIRSMMGTPESFRDYSVAVYERLAAKIETDFTSGAAIGGAEIMRQLHKGEDRDALYSDRPITADEKKQCLAKARADAQARIRIVNKHYREMYAAANKALPVLELLTEE